MRHIITVCTYILILTGCSVDESRDQRPNIIYVLADDLGYGDISCFNMNGKIYTPNLDRMASYGIKFTDAHSSSSLCTPTRYGILTGRYNWRSSLKSGVLTGKSKALILSGRTTVASMLQNKEYKTAFIGKWHLGFDCVLDNPKEFGGSGWRKEDYANVKFSEPVSTSPNDLGFDYSFILPASLSMPPYVYLENGLVTMVPDTTTVNKGKYTRWIEGPTAKNFIHKKATPDLFEKAIGYVNNNASNSDPFFLYLALPSPHSPFFPLGKWKGISELNPYADFIMMIDDYMGQLLSTVQKMGIEKNTLIFFVSDNGPPRQANIAELKAKGHNPSHIYRGIKGDIFEGGHRIPFIVKWPQVIKKGIVSNETICTTDLMATLAEIIGYQLSDQEAEDSYSMIPLFKQNILEHSFREATVHHSANGCFAIRKDEWKLIMCPDSGGGSFPSTSDTLAIAQLPEIQLYNLIMDPGETLNQQSQNSEKVEELKILLTNYILDGRSTPGASQKNDPIETEWKQIDFIQTKFE